MTAPDTPRTRVVHLTDDELVCLDGHLIRDEVQAAVDAASRRITARDTYPDLPTSVSGLVADIVTEAETNGRIVMRPTRIRWCSLCGTDPGYVPYKSGPNRGLPNLNKPRVVDAYEFADRFVRVHHHVTLGGCTGCVAPAIGHITEALRSVRAELPDRLALDGEPRWKRYDRRRCTECGWEGHEGEMRQLRTLMGDGYYPGGCPACPAENLPLGRRPIESADGYEVEVLVEDGDQ